MSDLAPYNASKVTERFLVGGGLAGPDELAMLKAQGVTHVISAAAELDDSAACRAAGLGFLHIRWADDGQRKPEEDFRAALVWVLEQDAPLAPAGRQIGLYIHCAAGVHRGPLLATYLLGALSGISAHAAWDVVKAGRPVADSFNVPNYERSCVDALAVVRPFRPLTPAAESAGDAAAPAPVAVPAGGTPDVVATSTPPADPAGAGAPDAGGAGAAVPADAASGRKRG